MVIIILDKRSDINIISLPINNPCRWQHHIIYVDGNKPKNGNNKKLRLHINWPNMLGVPFITCPID
tara:strand:+ start:38 stop:235 length:198 start_codon:yes stop_codon:yes gene_type:complete